MTTFDYYNSYGFKAQYEPWTTGSRYGYAASDPTYVPTIFTPSANTAPIWNSTNYAYSIPMVNPENRGYAATTRTTTTPFEVKPFAPYAPRIRHYILNPLLGIHDMLKRLDLRQQGYPNAGDRALYWSRHEIPNVLVSAVAIPLLSLKLIVKGLWNLAVKPQ